MTDQEIIDYLMEATDSPDTTTMMARVLYDRYARLDAESNAYGVYVQVNADDYVTAIDSDAFITDRTLWIKVDEGIGELYKYARVNYCPAGLESNGGHNYKLVGGKVVYSPQVDAPTDHNEMASTEDFFIASRRYEVGELINIQGRMYEVISIILSGSTIIPDTNVKEITLEQYINKKIG